MGWWGIGLHPKTLNSISRSLEINHFRCHGEKGWVKYYSIIKPEGFFEYTYEPAFFNPCAPYWCAMNDPQVCHGLWGGGSFVSRTIGGCESPTSSLVCLWLLVGGSHPPMLDIVDCHTFHPPPGPAWLFLPMLVVRDWDTELWGGAPLPTNAAYTQGVKKHFTACWLVLVLQQLSQH